MQKPDAETFCPTSRKDWREWLEKHHRSKPSVWIVYYKKGSKVPSITYNEAVEEALCFGWIDSVKKTLDHERFTQFFSKRKPKGTWSKVNKEKVKQLIASELMFPAGHEAIAIAQQNGSWIILDEVEELVIPKDLAKAFKAHKGSKDFFMALSKSVKKAMLQWLALAKQPATREKRISEIAELAGNGKKPKQF